MWVMVGDVGYILGGGGNILDGGVWGEGIFWVTVGGGMLILRSGG